LSVEAQNLKAWQVLQERGEVYFRFENSSAKELLPLSKIISIDKVDFNHVYAYANSKEFQNFLDKGLEYEVLTPPSMLSQPVMKDKIDSKSIEEWDFYPTYEGYLDMMYQFESEFPDLCQIISIGQSIEGRELLVARISDNVGVDEGEAQFLYIGTIHGDETTGFVLLLRLIDYLLNNYGTDDQVTNMIENLDIWINPAANPDGTYAGGNNTVYGSTRYNANGVDLNRNFPDPEDGPHPDGNEWQPETVFYMEFAEENHFVVSANTHGGTEVCNYPWDTWPDLHADDDWWQYVCHEYADTAQLHSPPGYMSGYDDGITNGYAWYTISGGRQDYMNYFHQCREFTLEISDIKTLPANQLPALWEYNYRSLLNYMEQTLFGISGTITDAGTGDPLMAQVFIDNHDIDSSMVFSNELGKYYRPIHEGTYDITFSAPGYYPQTIENVSAVNRELTVLNVQLESGELIADFVASATSVPVGSEIDFTDLSYGNPTSWEWTFEGATPSASNVQNPQNILFPSVGTFDVSLTVSDGVNSQTITKEDYITVSIEYYMQNTTITTCEGVFYDTGGPNGNYGDNEDFTMTFLPASTEGKIEVEFTSFSVEDESSCDYDWLKIYDGSSTSSNLIGTYCGNDSPGTIMATNTEGALTFEFHSDYSVTEPGWTANITCQGGILPPVADFMASNTNIIEGESVQFTDLSSNNPDIWEWSFEGGTPATSNEQNPEIIYYDEGIYSVSLTVTNEGGSHTITKEEYIHVDHITGLSLNNEVKLTVHPNPTRGKLNIKSHLPISNIKLINLIGEKKLELPADASVVQLDLDRMEKGFYFLIIYTESEIRTEKIQIL
jgi:PKD repeat protein/murein tripeptide amidase MpaA